MMKDLQQKHLATLMQGEVSDQESADMAESQNICRICHSSGSEPLLAPCHCSGSAKHVHASCLLTWFKKAVKNTCELCRCKVAIKKKGKPLAEVITFRGFTLTKSLSSKRRSLNLLRCLIYLIDLVVDNLL